MQNHSLQARPQAGRSHRALTTTAVVSVLGLLMALLGLTSLPVSAATATPSQPEETSRPVVLDKGHVDAFYLHAKDGKPTLSLKEDVTGHGVMHDPETVQLDVVEQAKMTLPAVPAVPEALHEAEVYYLPLNQNPQIVWPGWDNQGLRGTGYDQSDIEILDVSGPGEVYLWTQKGLGELDSLLTDDGYKLPGTIHQDYHAHVHANWAFTKAGYYDLTVRGVAINSETGERAPTEEKTYRFRVGDFQESTPEPIPDPENTPTVEPTTQAPTQPETPSQPTDSQTPGDDGTPGQDTSPSQQPSESQQPSPSASDKPKPSPSQGKPADDEICWDGLKLDHGHVDMFNLEMIDKKPTLTLKEDVTGSGVIHDPADVELNVKDKAQTTLPKSDGIPAELAGKSGYYLPLLQDDSLIWPGWDSQGLNGTDYSSVDFKIEQVTGPGEVYLWSSGGLGGVQSLLTGDSYKLPGTIHQDYLAHVHANWFFTKPGAYFLRVSAEAHNEKTGQSEKTNAATYLVTVGADLPEGYNKCPKHRDDKVGTTPDNKPADQGNDSSKKPGNGSGGGSGEDSGPAGGSDGDHGGSNGAGSDDAGDQDSSGTGADGAGTGTGGEASAGNGGGSGGAGAGSAQQQAPQCLPVEEWNRQYGQGREVVPPGDASGSQDGTAKDGATRAEQGEQATGLSAGEGHFDLGPVVEDGKFVAKMKDDRTAPPVWRNAEDLTFVLGDAALRSADSLPGDLEYVAESGKDVYMIQQVQEPGVPWVGWNTQHESVVNGPGSQGVTMSLENVEGPGELAVFLNGNFGQLVGEKVFDTVGGPKSYQIPANTHQHGNWVFTEPGTYKVSLKFEANGQSATGTYTFQVGAETARSASVATPKDENTDQDLAQGDQQDAEQKSDESSAPATSVAPNGQELTAGQGLTPEGTPCTLAKTGADEQVLSMVGIGAGVVALGTAALLYARRRATLNAVGTVDEHAQS
ncbi:MULTISPECIES: TIGR03773 family transporter-associated surface protein [Auritidibacter]|uniref:TIGR03773 family transporter-associated surface protein n=1 Tax=Auritidibacter TaxID=1160973 RepID=UPI000D734F3B|nr:MULTISPECIES: TIGR03773 family transporter-associated surface protein [Auritidibacter]AXR73151.1 LPXTG cell wall anchor domain-containing protein [Auritidibacter sp. NML130574]NIH71601.1 putative ABC transporter-associated repeat protein [Auritidibacter ignavus]PXA81905.1 hypothetical protein DCC25_00525 [Auritidibacter sp. NML120636]RMX24248.1 LPXTG cell wall anchor domain-containing protein [Auritidibacter ignavus]WGH81695.1 TIGR03773 family transporter-associated surface protein [Auritid